MRAIFIISVSAVVCAAACLETIEDDDCVTRKTCADASGGATTTAGGNGGMGGMAGPGGSTMGGGGVTGCEEHTDCTNPANAQCGDDDACVPCTNGDHCAGVADADICLDGDCVECTAMDQSACLGAGITCDLTTNTCVDVPELSAGQCEPCTNDLQCALNHACVPLDFGVESPHGYYCLAAVPPACPRPFIGVGGKTTINGVSGGTYCGVTESVTTCEAVNALRDNMHCTNDGACSESMGGIEVPVAGAVCRDLFGGASTNRCTYACGSDDECPLTGNGRFCGAPAPNDFCGGATM